MKAIIAIVYLVTWQYTYEVETGKVVENGGPPQQMSSAKACLDHIRQRVLPETRVEAFRRYSVGTSDPAVISRELSCVIF